MKDVPNKKIFISYRVQDTAGETGRLVDALKHHFADDQIFMDIENLEPGADFTEAIDHSLGLCDVMLVVIGPRWAGPREGKPSRIHDENDWVRQEVATALRRNVRVVPLLVDGGTLPSSEDLPPDLLPLVKRQCMEISNKRWRYDTEQLAVFLVKTVGIPPRRSMQQRMLAQQPQKNRTWLYVAGGFALAIALVVGLVLMAPEEKAGGLEQEANRSGTTQQNILPTNTVSDNDITGTWQEVDEGLTTTFVITQSGTQVDILARIGSEQIGSGSGTISGSQVNLNVSLFNIPTTLSGDLSADGQIIQGIYNVPATGESTEFKLVRQ